MCFSEPVSWATFSASMAGCALLFPHNPALAGTLAVVGSMQAYEALLWRDHENRATIAAAIVTNHVQPFVFLGLSAFQAGYLSLGAALCTLAYAIALPAYFRTLSTTTVKKTPEGLVWQWNYGPHSGLLYGLFLASLVGTALAYYTPWHAAVVVVTYALSYALYQDTNMVGSMWCFFAAFLPFVALAFHS